MKIVSLLRLLCVACLVFVALAAQAGTQPEPVTVHYKDPQHFTEARYNFGIHMIAADAYLKPLKAYIAKRAARILAPGERLDIEVTDVDLAGQYEPWLGPDFNDVRIVKRIYPPRIDLNFTVYGADGKTLRTGSRKLRDPAFLDRGLGTDQDGLRYEKTLIDLWLRKGVDQL
ncbi:MAG: DUF3016 domain-containing protein [Pseudomonadota bacterium]|nr:DUF3016 domain-containing protein [Pseudomonadota bacterium]